MSELKIEASGTPNPNALKLTLSRTVAAEGKTYRDAAAADVPWARALLGIPGIVGLYAFNNFISINKTPEAQWDAILPKAEEALRAAL